MAAVVDFTIFYTDMKTADGILTLNTLPPAVYGNNHFRLKMMDRHYKNEKSFRSDIFKLELVVDNHQIEFIVVCGCLSGYVCRFGMCLKKPRYSQAPT